VNPEKPTSPPPAGWEWVLNDTEDPPVWTVSRITGPEGAWVRHEDPATGKVVLTWNESRPDGIYIDGVKQVDPGRTPTYAAAPRVAPTAPSARTPYTFSPGGTITIPQQEKPYVGNTALPPKNPWQTLVAKTSKWSWKPRAYRKV
jgi:hypothetical protein